MDTVPQPRRVALVITKFAIGGAQETVLALAGGLAERGVHPILFTGLEADAEGTVFDDAAALGLDVRPVPELGRAIRPGRDLRAVRALVRAVGRAQVDVVHTHSSKAGLVGRVAARRLRVPVVHTVHGWSFNDDQAGPVRGATVWSERLAARITDALVVVARSDVDKGLRHGIGRPDQYHVIRSGLDLSRLVRDPTARRRLRDELGIPDDGRLVGTVGRIADQKDPLTMVDAVRHLVDEREATWFVWVGDGPRRPEVEDRVRELGLADRFLFTGVRRDVPSILSALDVFALSSRWEGLPRTLTEAMAIGVPVVATAVDGCVELLEDHPAGALVPSRDGEALAGAIERFLDDPDVAGRARAAADAVVHQWDRAEMVDATLRLYGEVLSARALGTHPR